jgi:hypothetical protein
MSKPTPAKAKQPAKAESQKSYRSTFTEEEAEAVGFAIKSQFRELKGKSDEVSANLAARLQGAYDALDTAEEVTVRKRPRIGAGFFPIVD